jgi:Zn-dependent metalloprotease
MKHYFALLITSIFSVLSFQVFSQPGNENFEKFIWNEDASSYSFIQPKKTLQIAEQNHLQWLTKALACEKEVSFELFDQQSDDLGYVHYRYKQYYNKLEVEFSRYYVHVLHSFVQSANGDYYPGINIGITPSIDMKAALQEALKKVNADEYYWEREKQDALIATKPQLLILPLNNQYHLAYRFDIYSLNPHNRQYIYIDAQSGEYLLSINKIHFSSVNGIAQTRYSGTKTFVTDSLAPNNYILKDVTRGNSIVTKDLNQGLDYTQAVDFVDLDNNWTDTTHHDDVATDIHWGMQMTYDYFKNKHNRNSYDMAGSIINNFAHAGNWLSLSFWDGIGFYFGDGDGVNTKPFGSLDIVAHEFTHAVIEYSAGLTYLYEAGGLQESFADMFAVCVDYYVNQGFGNYMIGEDITLNGQPMRNMASPKTKNQPDTYQGQYWSTSLGNEWINSGVQNYWFFLLTSGDNGINDNQDTFSITGIGIEDAAKIIYRSLTTYLTPLADYDDARFASIQSAIDLFGSCSPIVKTATNAWWAVGVGAPYQKDSLKARFMATNTLLCNAPAEVQFINNSTNASFYLWDFGDNTSSSLPNPVHTYQDTGYYTVSLSVWDTSYLCGTSDTNVLTKTNYIHVKKSDPVYFTASNTNPNAGCEIVQLLDQNESCAKGWEWIITPTYYSIVSGDLSSKNLSVRFDSLGIYSVKLVLDYGLSKDSLLRYQYISVGLPKDCEFSSNMLHPRINKDTITLYDLHNLCAWERNWSITPSSYNIIDQAPDKSWIKLIFSDTGSYDIRLDLTYGSHVKSCTKQSYIHALDYCIPIVSNLNQDIGISYFEFGDILNNSNIGVKTYTDYTEKSTTLAQYDTVVFKMKRNSNHNHMNRKIWIDYNADGDFSDPGELVAYEASSLQTDWSDTVFIPGNSCLGNTIIRLGTSLMGMSNLACGVNTYGEFEDYRLEIKEIRPLIAKLKSKDSLILEQCAAYVDSGYIILRQFNPIDQIDTLSNLDITTPGQYYLEYHFVDSSGYETSIRRTLFVAPMQDISDEFYLNGKLIDSLAVGYSYPNPGFQVNLNCNIIKTVSQSGSYDSSIVGIYYLNYYLESHLGQLDTVVQEIHVVDTISPSINLTGSADTNIMVHATWNDPGIVITDNYYSGISPVIVGKVETDTLGDYTLYYSAVDPSGNYSDILIRNIHVVDTEAPDISSTAYSDGDTVRINVFTTFYKPDIQTTDNYFEPITTAISGSYIDSFGLDGEATRTGCFSWIFSAQDASGNTALFTLHICVEDHTPPEITLFGNSIVNLASPKHFEDDSFSVSDNYDQNITVVRSGDYFTDYLVNFKLGFYYIYYDATDAAGNKAIQKSRMLNVDRYSSMFEAEQRSYRLYPNPNSGYFSIAFEEDLPEDYQMRIFTALGQEVEAKSIVVQGSRQVDIDLGEVKTGLYFVQFCHNNQCFLCKLSVER